jgi:hypothetical protein
LVFKVSPKLRTITSSELPAGAGTTTRTGLSGHSAWADKDTKAKTLQTASLDEANKRCNKEFMNQSFTKLRRASLASY